MQDVNEVALEGNLTRDARVFHPRGRSVVNVSLGVECNAEGPANRKLYITVEYWDARAAAEDLAARLRQGDRVRVEGQLYLDKWEKDGQKHSMIKCLAASLRAVEDVGPPRERPPQPGTAPPGPRLSGKEQQARDLFRHGASVEEVCRAIGRAKSTVEGYLASWIGAERPASVQPWVDEPTYARVVSALENAADNRLKPIFQALGEEVSYAAIRCVKAHRNAMAGADPDPVPPPTAAGGTTLKKGRRPLLPDDPALRGHARPEA
ncbi:helix-turn-helix domain-containing protein [Planctomycetota bacterium]